MAASAGDGFRAPVDDPDRNRQMWPDSPSSVIGFCKRVTSLHDLLDAACDTAGIGWTGYLPGHVPIIDASPRSRMLKERLAREAGVRRSVGHRDPRDMRCNERSNVERVNAMPRTAAAAATSACAAMPGAVATRCSASWR